MYVGKLTTALSYTTASYTSKGIIPKILLTIEHIISIRDEVYTCLRLLCDFHTSKTVHLLWVFFLEVIIDDLVGRSMLAVRLMIKLKCGVALYCSKEVAFVIQTMKYGYIQ